MKDLDSALAWLDGRAAEMEALLRELVEISSHTPDRQGVTAVGERYLAAALELGRGALEGALTPSHGGQFGAHLTLGTPAAARTISMGAPSPPAQAGSRAAVLLIGHHDTVFPRASFAGFREDGVHLRGPGVLDMKGGLVVMAFALGALAEAGLLAEVPVRIISVSDEEVGSPEGRTLIHAAAPTASAALVFESGRQKDLIITRRKGTGGISAVAGGKAAHAGNLHHEGANAIWALSRFVDRAQAITDYDRGITVNVGKVSGGIGKNTVPDRAEALIDFRYVTEKDGREVEEALRAAASSAAASLPGTTVRLEGGVSRLPLERTEASASLAAEYGACARAAGLGSDESPLLGGGSDANTAAAAGVPAIDGLGPRGKGFHTVEEHIERATLVPKAAALARFLAGRVVR